MNVVSILKYLRALLLISLLMGFAPFFGKAFVAAAQAQLHPPEIQTVYPLGGQAAGTTRVTITGVSFRNASDILFDTPGIMAKIIPPAAASLPVPTLDSDGNPPVVADLTTAKDLSAGIYAFRIVSPAGVSNVGHWAVGYAIPNIEEHEPNDQAEQAQSVALPVSINGHISQSGDQDTFAFDLEAGKTLVAQVQAAIVDSPLDSLLTLHDANGKEVASNDDYTGPDSLLVYSSAKSGHYFLTIASAVGRFGSDHAYRLNIGYLPLLQGVYPLNAQEGTPFTFTPIGFNLGSDASQTITLSKDQKILSVALPSAWGPTNRITIPISKVPSINEHEPNDDVKHANTVYPPCIVNGRFWRGDGQQKGDIDYFRFQVEAGRHYIIEARSRSFGLRADPILTLLDSGGNTLATAESAGTREPSIDYTFTVAGNYTVVVRDIADRSAPDLVYRLNIVDPPPPDFTLSTETRGRVMGPGDNAIFEISVGRDRWNGPVTLAVEGLPAGVTAAPAVIQTSMGQALLILSAASNAMPGAFPLRIVGIAEVNGQKISHVLTNYGDWVWKGGARTTVPAPPTLLTFHVGAPAETALKTNISELMLVAGQSAKLHVQLERRIPYAKPVTIVVLGLPGGVTAAPVTLQPNIAEADLELKAQPNALSGSYVIAADALVSNSPQVMLDRPTLPITLTVLPVPKAK